MAVAAINTDTLSNYPMGLLAASESAGGFANNAYGAYAEVYGHATNYSIAVLGDASYSSAGTANYAGYFLGDVYVSGTLSKGGGTFKIDHPQDPENKFLTYTSRRRETIRQRQGTLSPWGMKTAG